MKSRASRRTLALLMLSAFIALAGCSQLPSLRNPFSNVPQQSEFLSSGTIIVSLQVPTRSVASDAQPMAALIGYIPPTAGFVPAENETWLEIDRQTRAVTVYKGKELVRQLRGEGTVSVEPGVYALQHKQKQPLWYAPDEYFRKRHLAVPKSSDRLRYRRGALGPFVLYPTTSFPIHSAPLWSEEVGGLRLAQSELSDLYYMLPVGANVVVK